MRVFVFSDNDEIFMPIHRILSDKNIDIKYFCSPHLKGKFKKLDFIKPKDISNDYKDLLSFDIGFSIHSKMIFPKELVEKVRCFNLHPGYNPYNRGIFPHVFSIINGQKAGATLHVMNEKIDDGAIIDREEIKINSYDTSLSLYERILCLEVAIFRRNLDSIIGGTFKCIDTKNTHTNYHSMRDFRNLCNIDLDRILSMQEAIDYLRALSHKPYKNAYFIDKDGNKVFVRLELECAKNTAMGGGRRRILRRSVLRRRILEANPLILKSA